ncbi:hypothetical protein BH20VER2_BH20VER2_08500 [soil metagenome]
MPTKKQIDRFSFPLAALLAFFTAVSALSAAPGAVDLSFDAGPGPIQVWPGEGTGVLLQPDGKIIVGGNFNGWNLTEVAPIVRLQADGSLDTSFESWTVGFEGTNQSGSGAWNALALQPNGQVLVAPGQFNNRYGPRALLRLEANGHLDATFNPQFASNQTPRVRQAVVLGDGRILVAGNFTTINGISRPLLARLNADGSVDQSFTAAEAGPFRVLPSGKIIVSVGAAFYRLHSDGSRDPSFVGAVPGNPYNGQIGSFVVQADERIVYAQRLDFFGTDAVRRLQANGSNDASFATFSGQFINVQLVQSDKKILISGGRLNHDGTPDPSFDWRAGGDTMAQQSDGRLVTTSRFNAPPHGVRRLLLDGSVDPSFAPGAGLTLMMPQNIERACLLPDGRVAVAGRFNHFAGVPRNSVAVLQRDGTVDPAFDSGDSIVPSSNSGHFMGAIVAQPDGKVLVAFENKLVRLEADGSADATFNYTPAQTTYAYVTSVAVQPDRKILVYGPDGLVRLFPDGSRDPSFQAAQNGPVLFVEPDGKVMVRGGPRVATRLHPDGALDAEFQGPGGAAGLVVLHAMALQPNGQYLISHSEPSNFRDAFVRLNRDGSVDPGFAANVASVKLIAMDADGIIVGGNIAPRTDVTSQQVQLGVARLRFDGTRDNTFRPVEFNSEASLSALLPTSGGQLFVTGNFRQVNGLERRGIARISTRPAPDQLANLSTRARLAAEEPVAIGGFIITGDEPKTIMVRALGPSLSTRGIAAAETLADPSLQLHDGTGAMFLRNDNWRDTDGARIAATGLAPASDLEAAIVTALPPGAYTAVVQGGQGLALVEIYDLATGVTAQLANISTRARVQQGDNVMIGGFILGGSVPSTVVVRAIGPSLAARGVADPLANPTLTLHDQSGNALASNDDWREGEPARIEGYGLGSLDDRESALIATLPPGPYTAIVRSAGEQQGVALVEVYQVE